MENEYVAICSNSYEKVKEFKSVATNISRDAGVPSISHSLTENSSTTGNRTRVASSGMNSKQSPLIRVTSWDIKIHV